jgi:hypothetical protein
MVRMKCLFKVLRAVKMPVLVFLTVKRCGVVDTNISEEQATSILKAMINIYLQVHTLLQPRGSTRTIPSVTTGQMPSVTTPEDMSMDSHSG